MHPERRWSGIDGRSGGQAARLASPCRHPFKAKNPSSRVTLARIASGFAPNVLPTASRSSAPDRPNYYPFPFLGMANLMAYPNQARLEDKRAQSPKAGGDPAQ